MKVSMKQIADMTGVSTATVSNALHYKRGVNAETSAKVLKAAQELGYFEDRQITKVRFVTFKRNGSVVEDTPFFPLMLTGIEQECHENGMDLIMTTLDMRNSDYDEQLRTVLNDKSSAIIMLGTEMIPEDINILESISTPFVVVDFWDEDVAFNCVQINNEDSVRSATRYLLSKGHKEIGYLRGKFRITPFKERGRGYRSALRRAKISLNEKYILELGPTIDTAYADMKAYLNSGIKLPTAFIADNDIIALGAMRAMTEKGIKIPEDVSIIGFDDLPYAAVASTPLTTLNVPKQEMGRICVNRLKQIIDGDTSKAKIQIAPKFVKRESVKELK